ncbi:MAG: ABC transporter substrate-binding protein [Sulfurimonas sp.]|nr:MAG: ABC transporter substrate-binding protein [Sulfurimonas sp.]
MRLLILILIVTLLLQAEEILVINSNAKIEKYKEAEAGFRKSINRAFKTLDIADMKSSEVKEYLNTENPDIAYAIGSKAYQYANMFIPNKKIFFSSIMNWKKLNMSGERFGISHDLHSEMQLMLIKLIFSDIKTIGIIYSKHTQDVMQEFKKNSKNLRIKILPKQVSKDSISDENFVDILSKTEAMIVLPDPILLSDDKIVKKIFKLSKEQKKPVFAYHKSFIKYGAALVTSVDNQTIGRQVATMINSSTYKDVSNKVLHPAGTKVIFNKKVVIEQGIKFDSYAASIITEVIE